MDGAVLRLKMFVQNVKSVAGADGEKIQEEIALNAVYGPEGSPNAQWSKWTPSASLSMLVNNPQAFGKILPGQFVFIDLTPTTKEAI